MSQLARCLFQEVSPDFFRVLSSPQSAVYVDVLDALEQEASQRNHGISRDEALAIVEQVVVGYGHRAIELEGEASTGEKARSIIDVLFSSGWLHEEQRSDWQRLVYFDSNGALLVQVLRKIAMPDSVVFSDKIVNVCSTLANRDALYSEPWPEIESCIANLQTGLSELRSMQRSIQRHTKKQLATSTLRENLSVLFDEFAATIGRTCYSQLVHARLPSRLATARHDLEDLELDSNLIAKMQVEVARRNRFDTLEESSSHVRLKLDELRDLMYQVEPLADEIDRRTAEFARRSQARFRYLQETTSENRAKVQDLFETINAAFVGQRLVEIEYSDFNIPDLRLTEIRIPAGLASLCRLHLHRTTADIRPFDDPDLSERDLVLAQLAVNIRDSVTVSRANKFVARLPSSKGIGISSEQILQDHVHNDEDMVDLIACVLHAETEEANYEIHVPRQEQQQDVGQFDSKLRYRVERFTVIKK